LSEKAGGGVIKATWTSVERARVDWALVATFEVLEVGFDAFATKLEAVTDEFTALATSRLADSAFFAGGCAPREEGDGPLLARAKKAVIGLS